MDKQEQAGTDVMLPSGCVPVFPLSSIVFPKSRMPLRIFETRYLDMVKSCLRKDQGFAVMLIQAGGEVRRFSDQPHPELYPVGVYAKIVDWNARDDGCLGITIEGLCRVSLSSELSMAEDGLYSAELCALETAPSGQPPSQLAMLESVAQGLLEHPLLSSLDMDYKPGQPQLLASILAQWLPLSLDQKASVLDADSVDEQLSLLQAYLADLA